MLGAGRVADAPVFCSLWTFVRILMSVYFHLLCLSRDTDSLFEGCLVLLNLTTFHSAVAIRAIDIPKAQTVPEH